MRTPPNMPVLPGETAGPVGDGTVQGFQPMGYFALPKDDICRPLICCGDDDPIPNWTSDTAPTHTWLSVIFRNGNDTIQPQLGDSWTSFDCLGSYISQISQADADAQAVATMQDCVGGDWLDPNGDPVDPIFNAEVTCSSACAGGGSFFHTVSSGIYVGRNQNAANQMALQSCAAQAILLKFCLVGSLDGGCLGSVYSDSVSVDVYRAGMVCSIVSGTLPGGLSMGSLQPDGSISFTGFCNASGIFSFVLMVTDALGNYTLKPLSITVLEITTASLPNFQNGVAYTKQMDVVGGSGNYSWSITSGVLPTGLTLNAAGLISGTPTESGVFPLEFTVIDLG